MKVSPTKGNKKKKHISKMPFEKERKVERMKERNVEKRKDKWMKENENEGKKK